MHAHGRKIGLGAAVLCFILSCREPERHTNDLPPSKCEMAKVNCFRPIRPAGALVALARPAGKMEPPNLTSHGQRIGLRAAVVRFILSCRGPARQTNDLPQSKCEMAKVNFCRRAVALVTLPRPGGKNEPPNLACAWLEDRSRCCRCPFHRILSWAGATHQ